jgi:hypothetical protein
MEKESGLSYPHDPSLGADPLILAPPHTGTTRTRDDVSNHGSIQVLQSRLITVSTAYTHILLEKVRDIP